MTTTAITTTYVYDGPHVIAEYEDSGSGPVLARIFIYGPGMDEPVMMMDLTGAAPALYFYYYDGLGSVAALSNISGNIVEQYRYDAFGNTKVYYGNGTPKTSSSQFIGNPYMFTARRIDIETAAATPGGWGLYYYRARVYHPALARFMQTDPIGYYDAMNLYQYCGNNPVNWIDPWGLSSKGQSGEKIDLQYIIDRMNGTSFFGKDINLIEKLDNGIIVFLWEAGAWDSEFYDSYHDKYFEYDGRVAKGSEVNYFAMGMLMKRTGKSLNGALGWVTAWKQSNIAREHCIPGENVYHLPTENEIFFLIQGYNYYNPPAPYSPKLNFSGAYGSFYGGQ